MTLTLHCVPQKDVKLIFKLRAQQIFIRGRDLQKYFNESLWIVKISFGHVSLIVLKKNFFEHFLHFAQQFGVFQEIKESPALKYVGPCNTCITVDNLI